jgi:hypothetical protein
MGEDYRSAVQRFIEELIDAADTVDYRSLGLLRQLGVFSGFCAAAD